jgi:hypothetical protein
VDLAGIHTTPLPDPERPQAVDAEVTWPPRIWIDAEQLDPVRMWVDVEELDPETGLPVTEQADVPA